MLKLILSFFILSLSIPSFASQIVDLQRSELQAVEFYSKCASELKPRDYKVKSGNKGTFPGFGVSYNFELAFTEVGSEQEQVGHLSVRWDQRSRSFLCTVYDNLK